MKKLSILIICIVAIIFSFLIYRHVTSSKENDVAINASESALPIASTSSSPTATIMPTQAPKAVPTSINSEIWDNRFESAENIIANDIKNGFPGAVLLVAKDGEVIFQKAYGYLKIYDGTTKLDSPTLMSADTVFDIASLTKVYAAVFSIMKLIDANMISLDQYVYEILPEFDKDEYSGITIRQLITHTSGFPSDIKFFRPDVKEGEMFYSLDRDKTISLLSQVPLVTSPGEKSKYSDVGYMVLGAIVEKVSGMRLDDFITANVYEPLGVNDTIGFQPIENNFYIDNIACTERLGNTRDFLVAFPNIREYTLQGEVHDEKSFYSMGGVSGHAGLFSDATSINTLNQLLISGGTYNGATIFSQEVVREFTSVYNDATYQLGFAHSTNVRSLKDTVPFGTLSHTGWTGAFSLIDKENNLSIVLLTNKRHSPITDGDFEAASFDTGKYYPVVNAIYEALNLS